MKPFYLLAILPLVFAIPAERADQNLNVIDLLKEHVKQRRSELEYQMSQIDQDAQEEESSSGAPYSVIQIDNNEGQLVSNLIVFDNSAIYTDVPSYTVPVVSTTNPHVIAFSETTPIE